MRALAVAALLVAAVAAAWLATGGLDRHGGRDDRVLRRPASDRALIEALVARRGEALEQADASAYADTAVGGQRARDRRDARRARRVGLSDAQIAVRAVAVEGRSARVRVVQSHVVRGISGRFRAERTLRAVRTADGWRVRSVAGTRRKPPWEVAEQRRSRSRHFVVLTPPGIDTTVLFPALEAGYRRIRAAVRTGRLRRRYLVQVAADARQARGLTESIRGIGALAALTDSEIRQDGPAERVTKVLSQRLLVPWPPFTALAPEQRVTVIAHELTHAVLAGSTSGRTPAWLVEGLALWVSEDRRVADAASLIAGGATGRSSRRALTLTGLTHPDAIARLGGDAQGAAYAYSSAAAFYIVERHGSKALLDLYDAFNDEDLTGDGVDLTDQATRKVLRRPLARLERDLRRWIVTQAVLSPFGP